MQVTASSTSGQASIHPDGAVPNAAGGQDAPAQNSATDDGGTTSIRSLKEVLPDSAVPASIAIQLPATSQQTTASRSDTATASANHQTVTIKKADGSTETRSGGSQAWRNNNPGNIESTAGAFGSIGKNGKFLVFSNAQDGFNGLIANLKSEKNQSGTVGDAIKRWAPAADHNNTGVYIQRMEKWTGLSSNKKMDSLTPDQLTSLGNAIKRQEGWLEGTVTTQPASANP